MQFDSFSEFLAMGGYGFYVWLAFGVSLFCLVAIWGHTVLSRRKIIAGIQEFEARRARRKSAKAKERLL